MNITTSSIRDGLVRTLQRVRRHTLLLFVLFLLSIYGFLSWRIVTLNQVQPDQNAIAAKLKTAGVPRIDPDVLSKIQQLQDNSVGVQTLFDEARRSPFQE
ncbi:MAG TPA: hypothetical protein VF575_04135 [Candidatus Saccharimonadales bacterium]|jgi:hypothetical protein